MTDPSLFAADADGVFFVGKGERVPLKGMVSEGFRVVHMYQKAWFWLGYLADRKGVWFFNGRKTKVSFVTARADPFSVLDDDYGLDGENLYLEDRLVPGADTASFEWLDWANAFSRDRHRLYVKGGSHFFTFDEMDVAAAVAWGDYVSDRDHLFHHGEALAWTNDSKRHAEVAAGFREHHSGVVGWWHPDYPSDGANATPIAGPWYRTDKHIFFREDDEVVLRREQVTTFNLVRDADPESFAPIGGAFGRDSTRAFHRWRTIPGADPASLRDLGHAFCRDADGVFYNAYRVDGADPDSFVVYPKAAESIGLAKDARRVYRSTFGRVTPPFGHPDYHLMPIDGADAASFALCTPDGAWAVDDRRVYLWGEPSKTIDRASFAFLHREGVDSWAHDKNGLYNANGRRTIAGVDGASFVALNRFWGRDKAGVFCFVTARPQKAIDAATFEVTDDAGGGRDAAYVYRIEGRAVKKRKR